VNRKRQVNITLSDQEYAALERLVEWRTLCAADVIRGLITREAEISRNLTPLQADGALGLAAKGVSSLTKKKRKRRDASGNKSRRKTPESWRNRDEPIGGARRTRKSP